MTGYIEDVRLALERAGIIRPSKGSGLAMFALGAGVGMFAGATIALLLTPQTGPEMRKQIGSKAKEVADRTSLLVEKAKGTMSRLEAETRESLDPRDVRHGRNDVPVG